MIAEPILLALASVTLVLVGLGVVVLVVLFPALLALALQHLVPVYFPERIQQLQFWTAVGAIQWVHIKSIWWSSPYLAFVRASVYPIRKLIMPVVMFIVRLEFRKEKVPSLFIDLAKVRENATRTEKGPQAPKDEDAEDILLQSLSPSVRRRYRQMEQKFRRSDMFCRAVRSETSLNLSCVVPVMLEQERRWCAKDGKSLVEEFIKRFLVVVMTTNATLDQYYDPNGKLCGVQLSIRQGQVLHWFMYFCSDAAAQSGIWYHGILTAMLRGLRSPSIRFVNGQGHQTESKRGAGFHEAPHTDGELLSALYPWQLTSDIPRAALNPIPWLAPREERP